MGEDYQPREHDHLVEPMFGGLGVEGAGRVEELRGLRGILRRLLRALVRLVRPSRPGAGR